ncbi:MAG: AAA family ATPase, partial [Patescibacteria group bacterium]
MDVKLLEQIKTLNPWWEYGPPGIERYKDPSFRRELFYDVLFRIQTSENDQIVSVVGMRQVGKSTMMRQVIGALLTQGVKPKQIFYIVFDDTFLQTQYKNEDVFERVLETYVEGILQTQLTDANDQLYFFFDEITKLPNFEKILKTMYDRKYSIRYFITGSSAVELRKGNRESLLGRVKEFVLPPFSFREYLAYHLD